MMLESFNKNRRLLFPETAPHRIETQIVPCNNGITESWVCAWVAAPDGGRYRIFLTLEDIQAIVAESVHLPPREGWQTIASFRDGERVYDDNDQLRQQPASGVPQQNTP